DGIRDFHVTGVQTCALPICRRRQAALGVRGPPEPSPPHSCSPPRNETGLSTGASGKAKIPWSHRRVFLWPSVGDFEKRTNSRTVDLPPALACRCASGERSES